MRFAVPAMALCCGSVVCAQPMFEGATEFSGERLRGRPERVVVHREKLGGDGSKVLGEVAVYRTDGQPALIERYHDGKLSTAEAFEYDAQGRRTSITSRDGNRTMVRVQSFRRMPDGSEEEVESGGDGQETGRTLRRFDSTGRVIELRSSDTVMEFEYDDRGRPLEARVRFPGEGFRIAQRRPEGVRAGEPVKDYMMRVHIAYPGENQAVITLYEGNGDMLVQLESTEDEAGNQAGRVLFDREQKAEPDTAERIDKTDPTGNWTIKTSYRRNPRTQAEEAVARVHRTITYFSP